MPMSNPPFVLILAGGSGERFWPLSRRAKPKQLLKLLSERTLLEDTVARLAGFVPPERILILTNREQEKAVRAVVPELPAANIVAEPAKRDTAAAIALGVGWIARRDPTATMLVLPADHVIRDTAAFQRDLAAAAFAAEKMGALVTIGIRPTWACPGFGYIELGSRAEIEGGPQDGPPIFNVNRFREKPRPGAGAGFRRGRHVPVECGHVRLDAAGGLARAERPDPGAGGFCLARAHRVGFPAGARRAVFRAAKDFHRLRHHGKCRPRPDARRDFRLG